MIGGVLGGMYDMGVLGGKGDRGCWRVPLIGGGVKRLLGVFPLLTHHQQYQCGHRCCQSTSTLP